MKEKNIDKMNKKKTGSAAAADLRQRAEMIFREKEALSPKIIAAQSPAETWRMLHELRVHQIELEMQNEELRRAQAELDAGRARYFDLYNLAPVGYCTLSAPGLILEANLTVATLLGVDRKTLVKQPLSRFIPKEDQDIYYLHHKKLFATAEAQACELRLLKKDGRVFYGRLEATLSQDAGAEPICHIVISDIGKLKLAEWELRTLSLRNQTILEAIPDIIMEVDANKVYTWANRAGLEFFGADTLGKEAAFFFEGEQDVYDKVQPLFAGSENTFYVESWQRRRDGQKRLLAWWCRVLKDEHGNVSGALSTAQDITEVHRIEETLRESEMRFKMQYQGIPVPTFTWQQQGDDFELIDCNEAAKVLTQEKAISLIGSKANNLYTNRQDILHDLQRCLAEKTVIKRETLSEHFLPGQIILMSMASIPPDLVMVHMEDITERKKLEKEKEVMLEALRVKNEELERFTYSVSHDLKSPLVTIRTFTGQLEKDVAAKDSGKVKEDIEYIGNGAEKMSRLLDELLNLSRVGRKPNFPEAVTLQSLVKEASALVAGRLTEGRVEVNISKVQLVLHGDRMRLVEVFQNLLDNACKFMGTQKSPLIKIGVETKDDEAIIFVRDNGMGIDPQFLPKIFTIFEKLDRSGEGDGIGLALVKRIVEVHGGRIWVESDGPGKGTTFKFTLGKMKKKNE